MIRVLVVDDSALARKIITSGLEHAPDIEVVGVASDPFQARDLLIKLHPNVMTLDIDMPRMNGLDFLRMVMPRYPLPTIVLSAYTTLNSALAAEASSAGAVEVIGKPFGLSAYGRKQMMAQLRTLVRHASGATVKTPHLRGGALRPATAARRVIAIGASTGGTEALVDILSCLPPTCPGLVIVQHLPPAFTSAFATRLNSRVAIDVVEAKQGDCIRQGQALIAPAGSQCRVVRWGGSYRVELRTEPSPSPHCPSIDVLMESVAQCAGPEGVGVILTGMGRDGARGLRSIRASGGHTIAQDEQSSAVYGMPKAALDSGGVIEQLSLSEIGREISAA